MQKVISIAIPVYNEEANIQNVLKGVIRQKEDGFRIREIIVISDGSKDKTVEKVKEIKDKRIRIEDNKIRIGKSQILNDIFKEVNAEILVLFDGDVVLANDLVIKNLIQPILKSDKVGLTSGDFQPIEVKNFLQKAIKSTINVYEVLRKDIKGGHNPYGSTGRVMALSKKCYKAIYIPPTMVLNDIYTYFACLKAGFEFKHVRSARVYYQLPVTFADHISQSIRSAVGCYRISRMFGKLYSDEYIVPSEKYYGLLVWEFIRNPIGCIVIYILNKVSNLLAQKEINNMDAKWDMVVSTKTLKI